MSWRERGCKLLLDSSYNENERGRGEMKSLIFCFDIDIYWFLNCKQLRDVHSME
jgi:hypothetical protein